MSPQSSQPPPQGNPPSVPDQDDVHGPWVYNDMIQAVLHEPDACDVCSQWAVHLSGYRIRRTPSLLRAEQQRTAAARGTTDSDLKSLRSTNNILSRELNAVRDELELVNRKLREAKNDIARLENKYDDLERQTDETIGDRNSKINFLRDTIAEFERGHTPRRRKQPRHDSRSPSRSQSRQLSSRSSRPDSPMLEDQGPPSYRTSLAPLPLLSRMATTSLPSREHPPSSAEPSPSGGSDFMLQAMAATPNVVPYAVDSTAHGTPIADVVHFPSLLPVLYYDINGRLLAVPGMAKTGADGSVDFSDKRFVLAEGGLTPDGQPNWLTTLIRHERLMTEQGIDARVNNRRIPTVGLIFGGRNGVLISPNMDPSTDEEVETLFTTTNVRRRPHAAAYIERVRFTPPELRGEVHQHALERWPAVQAEQGAPGFNNKREPLPSAFTNVWKKWLQAMHKGNSAFKYPGIPRVGQGYQTAHIEGTKALLKFLPVPAGPISIAQRTIREYFLRAAATLLCVPEQYTQVLDRLGVSIAEAHSAIFYTEAQYGYSANISINEIAGFLAAAGTTQEEAERWRPWATAYIAMELETYPHSSHAARLRQAEEMAHARIDSDPRWALTNIPLEAPGNYNPGLVQARVARQAEASSLSNAEAGPSISTTLPAPIAGRNTSATSTRRSTPASATRRSASAQPRHADNDDENTVTLDYDEDIRMGPA